MEKEQWFALATVFTSGLFSLLVTVVTNAFSNAKEQQAFRRQFKKERVEEMRHRYEEILTTVLEYGVAQGEEKREATKKVAQSGIRLTLFAPRSIREQFEKLTTEIMKDHGEHMFDLSESQSELSIFYDMVIAHIEELEEQL